MGRVRSRIRSRAIEKNECGRFSNISLQGYRKYAKISEYGGRTRGERTVATICAGNVAKVGEYRRKIGRAAFQDDRTPRISRARRHFADSSFTVYRCVHRTFAAAFVSSRACVSTRIARFSRNFASRIAKCFVQKKNSLHTIITAM